MKRDSTIDSHTLPDPPKQPPRPGPTPPPVSAEPQPRLAFEETLYAKLETEEPSVEQGVSLSEVSFSNYEISGEVARGGLGRILKAKDKRLGRQVAIKELLEQSRARERFLQEALITARLQHPSIVPIYEAGVWPSGEPFYAMKFVSGKPLNEVISEAQSLSSRLLLLPKFLSVAEAIAYAHSQKIIHRDLKPQNILIGEFGETIVIDWGLAKDLSLQTIEPAPQLAQEDKSRANGAFTLAGAVMGTPGYMPPEQARGEPVDERADVYSLGAILYQLLAGSPPFSKKSSQDLLLETLQSQPTPLEQRQPDTPVELLTLVRRSMASHAKARYPSAKEFLEELQRFTSGALLRSHSYTFQELLWRWLKRYRAPIMVAVISSVLLFIGGALSLREILSSKRAADNNLRTAHTALTALAEEKTDSQRKTQLLLQGMGRQELSGGHFLRAAFYLNESSRHAEMLSSSSPGLRASLLQAMRPVEALLQTLNHEAPPRYAIFSPAKDLLLTEDKDKRISVWSTARGERLFEIAGEESTYPPLFAQGGESVLIRGQHLVTLWNAKDGKLLRSFGAENQGTKDVALSGDGELLAMVYSPSIEVYRLDSGEQSASLQNLEAMFFDEALFTPDNKSLIIKRDNPRALPNEVSSSLSLWDLTQPPGGSAVIDCKLGGMALSSDGRVMFVLGVKELSVVELPSLRILRTMPMVASSFALSSNNKTIAAVSLNQESVTLFDVASGRGLFTLSGHSGAINHVRFAPDSETLLTAGADGVLKLWDVSSGRSFASLESHQGPLKFASFSFDGQLLASASEDRTVKLWSTNIKPWSHHYMTEPKELRGARFTPDGDHLLSWGHGVMGDSVDVWRVGTGELLASIPGDGGLINSVVLSPDGARMVLTKSNSAVDVYSLAGERLLSIEGHKASVPSACFMADGARLVTASPDYTARVWDTKTGAMLLTHTSKDRFVLRVACAHKGEMVASSEEGEVVLWDASTGAVLRTLRGQEDEGLASTLQLSRSDEWLLARSNDERAYLWDTNTGALLHQFKSASGITHAIFSHDETQIFTASEDGQIILWDALTGKALSTFLAHPSAIKSMELGGDGRFLLTASTDKTAKLWDTKTRELIMSIEGHSGAISRAIFSPDDKSIATAGEDGIVKIWPIAYEDRDYKSIQKILEGRSLLRWQDGELTSTSPH